jgi:hypothetical protein
MILQLIAAAACAGGSLYSLMLANGAALHSGADDPSFTHNTDHDAWAFGFGMVALILAGLAGALTHGAFR